LLSLSAGARLGERPVGKRLEEKIAQWEMELFCTADVQLDLLSLQASPAAAPGIFSISFSQESLGNR